MVNPRYSDLFFVGLEMIVYAEENAKADELKNSEKDLREYEQDYGKPRKFRCSCKNHGKEVYNPHQELGCGVCYQSSVRNYMEVLSLSAAC